MASGSATSAFLERRYELRGSHVRQANLRNIILVSRRTVGTSYAGPSVRFQCPAGGTVENGDTLRE